MKLWKLMTTATLSVAFLFLPNMGFCGYQTYYEQSDVQILADGITETHILKLTDEGFLNVKVITIDLEKDNQLKVLYNDESIRQTEKLSTFVENDDSVVAAINGDFFDSNSKAVLGQFISEGDLIATGINDTRFASFNMLTDGRPQITTWTDAYLKISNGSSTFDVQYMNKNYLWSDRAIIYDQHYGDYTPGSNSTTYVTDFVVINDKITEIHTGEPGVLIPENGYVLSAVGTVRQSAASSFKVGDTLSITRNMAYDLVELSIGGGAQIVENGHIVDAFSLPVTGYHPRTAIGYSMDYKTLYMVTVDGRTNNYRGMKQAELAQLMIDIGAYSAINMDGGGSTELAIRSLGSSEVEIANTPSDGVERRIYNALAVSTEEATGIYKGFKSTLDKDCVFLGTDIEITSNFYDTNDRPMNAPYYGLTYSVEGVEGTFENNIFTASTFGDAKLNVSYGGHTESLQIKVLESVEMLEFENNRLALDIDQSQAVKIIGYDKDGYTAELDVDDLYWTINGPLIIEGDSIKRTGDGIGIVRASINGVETYLSAGNATTTTALDTFDAMYGQLSVYPVEVTGNVSTGTRSDTGGSVIKLDYDFTGTDSTRAVYYDYPTPLALPEGSQSLIMDAEGTFGNKHWLRAKILDANGVPVNLTFSQDIQEGWQSYVAYIPSGLAQPLTLDRIYLVEDQADAKDSGFVLIDNLSVTSSASNAVALPKSIDRLNTIDDHNLSDFNSGHNLMIQRQVSNMLASEILTLVQEGSKLDFSIEDFRVYSFKNDNYSLGSYRDFTPWQKFLDLFENPTDNNLIIYLTNDLKFADAKEETFFYDVLEQQTAYENIYIVCHSDGSSKKIKKNEINLISLNRNKNAIINLNEGKLGIFGFN